MSKHFVFLFSLLLLLYGLYLWREKQQQPTFRARLLSIDPSAVTGIDIRLPEGFDSYRSFSLLQVDGQWIASVDLLNMPADTEAVNTLIEMLTAMETTQLVGQYRPTSNRFGLEDDAHLRVRLRTYEGRTEGLCLGWSAGQLPAPDGPIYARLEGQQEIYSIPADRLLNAPLLLQDFNQSRLCSLQETDLAAFLLEGADTTIRCFRALNQGWHCNGRSFKSTTFSRYFRQLSGLLKQLPASDFDELHIQTRLRRKLTLYPQHATDSVVIAAFYEPNRPQPWLLNSSQYPAAWFQSDDTGLYQQLFITLDSLLK